MRSRIPPARRWVTVVVVGIALATAGLSASGAIAAPLSGAVLDGLTLEPIAGARVTVVTRPTQGDDLDGQDREADPGEPSAPDALAATADEAGGFAIAGVPIGPIEVRVEADGYAPSLESIDVPEGGRSGVVFILLRPGAASEVIEVTDTAPPAPTPPGKTDLRREELTRIPGTRGDALASIKSLPGVANADAPGAGPGIIVIRGAAPEDSKVTLDGVEIPLLYHFFGLQSVVPSEFIDSIDFLPGGFGVEEGRATGGVINIATRDEVVDHIDGFAEISFINFAGFVQGPISKQHHLQFAAGLRRSAIDLLLPVVIPDDANVAFTTAPQYYDGQLRIDWRPRYTDRVTALALGSFDLLSLLNDNINPNDPLLTGTFDNETSFTRLILSWNHAGDRLENRAVVAFGITGFRFEIQNDAEDRFLRFSNRSLTLRDDLRWTVSEKLKLRAGGDLLLQRTDAEIRFPLPPQEGSPFMGTFSMAPLVTLDEQVSYDVASAYLAADFRPIPRGGYETTVTPGLRLDHYDRFGVTTLSPRLAVKQALARGFSVNLAIGTYNRGPLVQEALQTTVEPERATQYVVGVEYDVAEGIKAQAAGFYTDRRALIVQDPVLTQSDPMNSYVNRGYGRSYGAEVLVRAKLDRLFGWVAYTVSRSDRIDGALAEQRLFDFDQTHNFIAVASYRLGAWELGGRWQYNTGNPLTPIEGSIYLADFNAYIPVYGEVNSDRLEPAHQLDLRVDRRWQFKTWSLSAYLDVTNVYAHPRAIGYQYNFDYSERIAIEELPLVPAIGVRGSF